MTDKEVGELWQCSSDFGCGNFSKNEVQRLIRKLVEERANYHHSLLYRAQIFHSKYHSCPCEKESLRDFGIPEDSWQENP